MGNNGSDELRAIESTTCNLKLQQVEAQAKQKDQQARLETEEQQHQIQLKQIQAHQDEFAEMAKAVEDLTNQKTETTLKEAEKISRAHSIKQVLNLMEDIRSDTESLDRLNQLRKLYVSAN